MTRYFPFLIAVSLIIACAGTSARNNKINTSQYLEYCAKQAKRTLLTISKEPLLPRSIHSGDTIWKLIPVTDWTSGFWPGTLWYLYEATNDTFFLHQAQHYTGLLKPLAYRPAADHDLGFMMYCSYGNGLRLTNDSSYRTILLATADTLATLFNPKVGTILSWPWYVQRTGTPHNTIVDNMMNLELLFWAGKTSGNQKLIDIANIHAQTTMKNHFRPDGSAYHVVIYDTVTGQKIKGVTNQGYTDSSMWARGQSWAIYGFTLCYRETGNKDYLAFAQKVANIYLKRLPGDLIPYWDFDAPNFPGEPKDASASTITASALLELSTYIENKELSAYYYLMAVKMIQSLNDNYLSKNTNPAFLLHSTGNMPIHSEVDASIIYADYYYLEALLRLQKLQNGQKLFP
jgi:unsaturated chondroitin disaccharide hydrolase